MAGFRLPQGQCSDELIVWFGARSSRQFMRILNFC